MSESSQSKNVVLIAAILTFGLGWFNSEKQGHGPSRKFLVGAGVTFTALSMLADFSPPAANALSLAIATTALFSEGSGVLTYLNDSGEFDTKKAKNNADASNISQEKGQGAPPKTPPSPGVIQGNFDNSEQGTPTRQRIAMNFSDSIGQQP